MKPPNHSKTAQTASAADRTRASHLGQCVRRQIAPRYRGWASLQERQSDPPSSVWQLVSSRTRTIEGRIVRKCCSTLLVSIEREIVSRPESTAHPPIRHPRAIGGRADGGSFHRPSIPISSGDLGFCRRRRPRGYGGNRAKNGGYRLRWVHPRSS